MTKILTIFLLLLFLFNNCKDRQEHGNKYHLNYLRVEGGAIEMKIDTNASISELVTRLNSKWKFIETGKSYWIGYTENMFSIAYHRESAIPVLLNFFKNGSNDFGKIGTIYTLHLIGIESNVAGRLIENFKNAKARQALLNLLPQAKYSREIVKLLMRDPWKSDVPFFINTLKADSSQQVTCPIISALNRYNLKYLPINNEIPNNVLDQNISIKNKNTIELQTDFDFNSQIKEALKLFDTKYSNIMVEKAVYDLDLSPHFKTKFNSIVTIRSLLRGTNLMNRNSFSYFRLGTNLFYYFEDGTLHLISYKSARERLVRYWNDERNNFDMVYHQTTAANKVLPKVGL